jgi:hypothetical protein
MPAALTGASWTCAPAANCGATSGSGNIATTVSLANGASATFTVNATVAATATGSVSNTATVAMPTGATDPVPGNNSATDTDQIAPPLPAIALLDNFNRANGNTLGASWSQITVLGSASIRVNNFQASAPLLPGWAMWNGAGNVLGAKQGAAFTFANAPVSGSNLILKGSGGTANTSANYLRVSYTGSAVTVGTTTNSGLSFTTAATFPASFLNGDTLSAVADGTGGVYVWKTTAASVTSFIGSVVIPTAGTGAWTQGAGGGRIGLTLPTGARVDNFSGATLP